MGDIGGISQISLTNAIQKQQFISKGTQALNNAVEQARGKEATKTSVPTVQRRNTVQDEILSRNSTNTSTPTSGLSTLQEEILSQSKAASATKAPATSTKTIQAEILERGASPQTTFTTASTIQDQILGRDTRITFSGSSSQSILGGNLDIEA